jgi:methylenetetrahydrofolate--tRNA-(uracil-5-)-methyltransferase
MSFSELIVIGGGLAGSEAAWQAAERGVHVTLYEMRPDQITGAHKSAYLGELVCSNSLGSLLEDRASGLLKNELRLLGSLLMRCADETAVPAGGALAVDREAFAEKITSYIEAHPGVTVVRQEITEIPDGACIIASGPLTSPALSNAIARLTGRSHLYFFDAIAPIVEVDSIDMDIAFRAARYGRGGEEGDYINCPMTREQYDGFVDELLNAERITLEAFELEIKNGVDAGKQGFFEGCLPVEIMAERGRESLAFGPLRPIGLRDPRTGSRPYAVVQLRQDNLAGNLYNMVGFQTNLRFGEQKRVFRLIPALEKAEFSRYGQMHRNTFIFSPDLLEETLQFKTRPGLFFAGQITGVEGYVGNIATGLLAGWNAVRVMNNAAPYAFPRTSMLGALCHYISHAAGSDFQPMKANFGILPGIEFEGGRKVGKQKRREAYVRRALEDMSQYLADIREIGIDEDPA